MKRSTYFYSYKIFLRSIVFRKCSSAMERKLWNGLSQNIFLQNPYPIPYPKKFFVDPNLKKVFRSATLSETGIIFFIVGGLVRNRNKGLKSDKFSFDIRIDYIDVGYRILVSATKMYDTWQYL
jgi:hypothetical protein